MLRNVDTWVMTTLPREQATTRWDLPHAAEFSHVHNRIGGGQPVGTNMCRCGKPLKDPLHAQDLLPEVASVTLVTEKGV